MSWKARSSTRRLDKIWAGEVTAEEALPELCKQVDQFLKDKGYPKK